MRGAFDNASHCAVSTENQYGTSKQTQIQRIDEQTHIVSIHKTMTSEASKRSPQTCILRPVPFPAI